MVPPGRPDFFSRRRFLDPGPVTLSGRAWSGTGKVESVTVSVDGGPWQEGSLEDPRTDHAWQGWRWDWVAEPGEHSLRCRARDSNGAIQPLEAPWNYQGMGNNMVQEVTVTVG
jgi:hypothetical protein